MFPASRAGLRASVLIACCLLPLSSYCQDKEQPSHKKEIFLQFGGSFMTGNTGLGSSIFLGQPPVQIFQATRESKFSKTGRVILGARYWFRANQALEMSVAYSPNELRWVERFPENPVSGESFPLRLNRGDLAFNYVRSFASSKRLKPFVTAGAGMAISDRLDDNGKIGYQDRKFVVNFGVGADFRLSPKVALRLEVRDFFSGQSTGGALQAPGGTTHNIVPSAGLAFRF